MQLRHPACGSGTAPGPVGPPLRAPAWAMAAASALVCGAAMAADVPGSRDHPAFSRYPGSEIIAYEQTEFDTGQFVVRPLDRGAAGAVLAAEGKLTRILYVAPQGRSGTEIFRNYQTALQAAGFTILYTCEQAACGRIQALTGWARRGNAVPRYIAAVRERDGMRVGLFVAGELQPAQYRGASGYELLVVEPRAVEQRVTVLPAAAIGRELETDGRVRLYAIQFDTDQAVLRPESDAQLREIAAWLARSSRRVLVVGHTDAAGSMAHNLDLSRRRASAVADALTRRFGVPAARLEATGVGMAAPVASNRTPAGAARNRRVELVELP